MKRIDSKIGKLKPRNFHDDHDGQFDVIAAAANLELTDADVAEIES